MDCANGNASRRDSVTEWLRLSAQIIERDKTMTA
jgi:hypothetical protein